MQDLERLARRQASGRRDLGAGREGRIAHVDVERHVDLAVLDSRSATWVQPDSMSDPALRSPMSCTASPVSRWPSSVTGGITAERDRIRAGASLAPLRYTADPSYGMPATVTAAPAGAPASPPHGFSPDTSINAG